LGRLLRRSSMVSQSYSERAAKKVRLEPGQRLVDKNQLNILHLP
jgi:hypothetical protein